MGSFAKVSPCLRLLYGAVRWVTQPSTGRPMLAALLKGWVSLTARLLRIRVNIVLSTHCGTSAMSAPFEAGGPTLRYAIPGAVRSANCADCADTSSTLGVALARGCRPLPRLPSSARRYT